MNSKKQTEIETVETSALVVKALRGFSHFISKLFWRIEFTNTANIPQKSDSGLIIAANHNTYFDPFWISIPVKHDLRFLAWDAAFKWFCIGNMIRKAGAFPVSLKRGGTIKALKQSLEYLENGKTLVIFPEGERGFTHGEFHKFKTGAARLAIEANVPILPVSIKGGKDVWSRDQRFPHLAKVEVIYHPLLQIEESPNQENVYSYAKKITRDLEKVIASGL